MNLKDPDCKFCVYIHTSPKGKRYVGITSKAPETRWGKDGKGYIGNDHFMNAISKYGWNSFKHEVIFSDLSLHDACAKEIELISKYNTMDPCFGYNHTTGGNWGSPDEATRAKLARLTKARCQDPEYMKNISDKLKGHVVSEETRKKMSDKAKGRKMPPSHVEAQRKRKHSPETIAKLRAHSGWCKGLTKDTDARVRQISESLKGRVFTDSHREKISKSKSQIYANGYSPIWINNGTDETLIDSREVIPEGYHLGRLNVRDTFIFRGSECKKVPNEFISAFLSEGWKLGRPKSVGDSIRKGKQRFYWRYEGIRFDSAEALASYLRDNGYPKIVSSTITSLSIKGFSNSKIYSSLDGKIEKVYV